ncbi:hypothetical protein [Calothrix sp. UHCC 0171]|uniref:hypothetical protein n=1 Tax=Calothrix sp. UHCC 0171 TaxID=3110245 RepID=UPI002B1F7C9A|nr:hypothetical protein [Calothrix sp. UHCC 0171]MEA5572895.1 hypothetical protein [Calothrix sp. UHCC 0171]
MKATDAIVYLCDWLIFLLLTPQFEYQPEARQATQTNLILPTQEASPGKRLLATIW